MKELEQSLEKLNNNNFEEVPPGFSNEEWKNYLELDLDDHKHLELIRCNECGSFHKIEIK